MRRLICSCLLLGMAPALACEPIIPMFRVLGGAAALGQSIWVLIGAVALKSILFSSLQPSMPHVRAGLLMVAANILTTVVGFLAAMLVVGVPTLMPLLGLPVIWGLALLPARRLVAQTSHPWLARQRPGLVASGVVGALILSLILFGASQGAALSNSIATFWLLKASWVYAGLFVSLFLTVYWEEWAIWWLAGQPEPEIRFLPAVARANIYTLLAVAIYASIDMVPQRWAAPGNLVLLSSHGQAHPPNNALQRTRFARR